MAVNLNIQAGVDGDPNGVSSTTRTEYWSDCTFCPIARCSTSTQIIHQDDTVVAFPDIRPAAFRHYLVIPIEHIPTVQNLQVKTEDYSLVSHMLNVGKSLLKRDAPQSEEHRFGFHIPPFNSIDHLHLHCLALPFRPSWKSRKYSSLAPAGGGFLRAEELLEEIRTSMSLIDLNFENDTDPSY